MDEPVELMEGTGAPLNVGKVHIGGTGGYPGGYPLRSGNGLKCGGGRSGGGAGGYEGAEEEGGRCGGFKSLQVPEKDFCSSDCARSTSGMACD